MHDPILRDDESTPQEGTAEPPLPSQSMASPATETRRAAPGEAIAAARPPAKPSWLSAADLAEGGLLADVTIILDLVTIYVPIVGSLVAPAVPAPFALLMLRRGPRPTLLAIAVAGFLVSILVGPHYGWRIMLEAVVGMLLGWAMRRRLGWIRVITLGTVVFTTVTFLAALGALAFTGLPLHDLLREMRNGLVSLATGAAWLANILGQRSLWLRVRPSLAALGNVLLYYWPLLFYLYSASAAGPTIAVFYAVANVIARVLGHDVRPFPPSRWLIILRLCGKVALSPWLVPAAIWTLVHHGTPATEGTPKQ